MDPGTITGVFNCLHFAITNLKDEKCVSDMCWLTRIAFVWVMLIAASVNCFADNNKYSLSFQETRLIEVISEIARETDIDLSFDPSEIPDERITHSFTDQTATSILFEVIEPYRLTTFMLPNGVFVVNKSIRRDLEPPLVSRFNQPVYGPLDGRIYAYEDQIILFRGIGHENRKMLRNENGEVTIPVFTKPMVLYLTSPNSIPQRISPFEINDGFELYTSDLPKNHPYPIP